jgi:hypothetical protein
LVIQWADRGQAVQRRIDQLIATHGARALLIDIFKEHDHVKDTESESPQERAAGKHTGNGEASGVTPAAGLAPAESSPQHDDPSKQAQAEIVDVQGEATARAASTDKASDDPHASASVASDALSDAAAPIGANIPVDATGYDAASAANTESAGGDAESLDSASPHGSVLGGLGPIGGTDEFGGANVNDRQTETRLARRLAAAIRKLLRLDASTHGEASPRYAGRALIREMVSRRYQLSRARRLECETELAILTVDVSGSCSSFSADLWSAAQAIARDRRGVAIELNQPCDVPENCPFAAVQHSNGCLTEDDQTSRLAPAIARAAQQRQLATVLALGDNDAIDDYAALAAGATRFVYLHNWGAKSGPCRATRAKLHETCGDWPVLPEALIVGVGNALSVLEALHLVLAPQARR